MITVLVQFHLPGALPRAEALKQFEAAAGQFQNVDGLVRKYFILNEDGSTAGGIYLWRNEGAARKMHALYAQQIKERFGADANVVFFHTPVIVDNVSGRIEIDKAA